MFRKITSLLAATALGVLAPLAHAQNPGSDDASRISRSISYPTAQAADATLRGELLQQAATVIAPQPPQTSYLAPNLKALHVGAAYNPDFSIYAVRTGLISDLDGDGFYHRFSLRIDADTVFDTAYVYARLYISYEGGPWRWYATSDNYRISGDSSLDSFVIETELAEGYAAGYYDIRIDLYDADYGDFLLSSGPYDDSSLAALPLEDSYRDEGVDDGYGVSVGVGIEVGVPGDAEVVVTAAAASSLWPGLGLAVLLLARMHRCRQRHTPPM